MSSISEQLSALATMSPAQLRSEWMRLYRVAAPALTADLLARGVAWKLQERAHGGLSASTVAELRRLKREFDRPDAGNITAGRIKPGTRLVRDWGGASHHVLILESGYLYQDRRYQSLSQIARDITGAHWSGPRFFGLTRRAAEAVNA